MLIEATERMSTGMQALDVVLGGETALSATGCVSSFGLRRRSVVVLAAAPGGGKTRVLQQICREVSAGCESVLCVSDERIMYKAQPELRALVKLRSGRTSLKQIGVALRRRRRALLAIDSLESLRLEPAGPCPFGMKATKRVQSARMLMFSELKILASDLDMCVVVNVMLTKEGTLPLGIEHQADAVVEILRSGGEIKFTARRNRYGVLRAA
jgi:DNA repair protein RadA/Sms